jgi:hypothetical protein
MLRNTLACVLMLGWLAATSAPVRAAAFDPELEWRTLETPHFNITFHQGEAALAEEVSAIAEKVWAKMTEELETSPKRATELVLIDPTDLANGYAMSLPVNTIVIFVTAPSEDSTLSQYSDWNDAILTHEYTHTLHLDTIEGLPKLLRMVFGRVININRASPGWMVEGLATLQETRHTPGGRGRSNVAHMIKRMAVLEDQFPPLGNMEGFQVAPPGGNLRYLFGQDFQQYIADEVGEDVDSHLWWLDTVLAAHQTRFRTALGPVVPRVENKHGGALRQAGRGRQRPGRDPLQAHQRWHWQLHGTKLVSRWRTTVVLVCRPSRGFLHPNAHQR